MNNIQRKAILINITIYVTIFRCHLTATPPLVHIRKIYYKHILVKKNLTIKLDIVTIFRCHLRV